MIFNKVMLLLITMMLFFRKKQKQMFMNSYKKNCFELGNLYDSNRALKNIYTFIFIFLSFCSFILPVYFVTLFFGSIFLNLLQTLNHYFPNSIPTDDGSIGILILLGISSIPALLLAKKVIVLFFSFYNDINTELPVIVRKYVKILLNIGLVSLTIKSVLYELGNKDLMSIFAFSILVLLFDFFIDDRSSLEKRLDKLEKEVSILKKKSL